MKKLLVFTWFCFVGSARADQILVDFELVPSQSLLQVGGYAQFGTLQYPATPQADGSFVAQWVGTIHASVNRGGIDPIAIEINPSTIDALPSGNWQPNETPADYGLTVIGVNGAIRDFTLDLSQLGTNLGAGGTFAAALNVLGTGTLDVATGSSYPISSVGSFTPGLASLTSAPLPNGDNLWTLVLPVQMTWVLPDDALTVVGTLEGFLTATADVPPPPVVNFPEPASLTLACVGLALVIAWRGWRV
ncbi:MAG: hypothetical protein AB7O68_14580 [Pirellulales bacterium]